MKVTAIVPIKLNNERLPGKNTKLLGEKPLIQYILETLDQCRTIDVIYVYCSDTKIQEYMIKSNRIKFLKRPKYLDEKTSNFTQIFEQFSREVDSDIYVYAHATAPYIAKETIEKCLDKVLNHGFDSAFTTEKIQDYLWQNNVPLNFDASNLPRSQDLNPIYRETSGVYVFTKEVFKKYKRRIGICPCPIEVNFKESIDINYPRDFEMAQLFFSYHYRNDNMNDNINKDITLLDCTLRDGGCVNSFLFGKEDMNTIKNSLEQTGIETIELGYINQNGSLMNKTMFINDLTINQFLKYKKDNTNYVAMIDYGTFDFNQLHPRNQYSIDGIRIAFHKRDRKKALESIKIISNKGYDVYVQPMIIMNYKQEELLELIKNINQLKCKIKALYIVDSFGQMMQDDVRRIFNFIDFHLKDEIKIGFHSHNNMQMSYINSLEFISIETNRPRILDCSLKGMGKGAGNLPTEMIISYLNNKLGKSYMENEVYKIIDSTIGKYNEEFEWGYQPKFLLSAKYGCTPSYISYFQNTYYVNLEQLSQLLGMLNDNKKISFSKEHADEVYLKYKQSHYEGITV